MEREKHFTPSNNYAVFLRHEGACLPGATQLEGAGLLHLGFFLGHDAMEAALTSAILPGSGSFLLITQFIHETIYA
jgi:hypothetical protein